MALSVFVRSVWFFVKGSGGTGQGVTLLGALLVHGAWEPS